MADEKKPDPDETDEPPVKADTTIPGGAYIQGGHARKGKHYGGRVVDCDGKVLAEFGDNEVNTGMPKPKPPVATTAK
jgi:hypothetical protein